MKSSRPSPLKSPMLRAFASCSLPSTPSTTNASLTSGFLLVLAELEMSMPWKLAEDGGVNEGVVRSKRCSRSGCGAGLPAGLKNGTSVRPLNTRKVDPSNSASTRSALGAIVTTSAKVPPTVTDIVPLLTALNSASASMAAAISAAVLLPSERALTVRT
jgi:hypothetical protein